MYSLETSQRKVRCRRCDDGIPAGQAHATKQYQDRSFWRVDRYCKNCAYTFLRPLIQDETQRLRSMVAAIETAIRPRQPSNPIRLLQR